jgi:hypothetical protein
MKISLPSYLVPLFAIKKNEQPLNSSALNVTAKPNLQTDIFTPSTKAHYHSGNLAKIVASSTELIEYAAKIKTWNLEDLKQERITHTVRYVGGLLDALRIDGLTDAIVLDTYGTKFCKNPLNYEELLLLGADIIARTGAKILPHTADANIKLELLNTQIKSHS